MAIPDEEVAQVRAATDIVGLISEHAALRQQGRRWTGLCPFHGEKTPSFSVNAEEGLYYCFGCQASGDAISFVRAVEHIDFADAVRYLAERAGVTLHESAAGGEDHRRRSALSAAMEQAVAWYHESLLSSPSPAPLGTTCARAGYDGAVVRQFRLGWAPDDWDALSPRPRALRAGADRHRPRVREPAGPAARTPSAAGSSSRSATPRATRSRSAAGSCRGARGPSRRPSAPPSPSTRTRRRPRSTAKRRTLYALNWAKKDIVAIGRDRRLRGLHRRHRLLPGRRAARRGHLRHRAGRGALHAAAELRAPHRARLRRRQRRPERHGPRLRVGAQATRSTSPSPRCRPARTPGELAQEDPEALRRAVGEARPFLQFRLDRVFAAASTWPPPRAGPAPPTRRIVVIAEHPSDLVRDQYVMIVSDRCRLEPDLLRARLEEARRRPPAEGREHGRSRSRGPGGRVANEPEEDPGRGASGPAPEPEGEAPPRRAERGEDPASRPGLEALPLRRAPPRGGGRPPRGGPLRRRAAAPGLPHAARRRRPAPGDRRRPARCGRVCCGGWPSRSRSSSRAQTPDPVDALVTNLTRDRGAPARSRDLEVAARTTPSEFQTRPPRRRA